MRIFVYWVVRTAIFAGVLVALWAVGWFDVLAVIAAFIIAWLISYLALATLRQDAALQMDALLMRARESVHRHDAQEDEEIAQEHPSPRAGFDGRSADAQ